MKMETYLKKCGYPIPRYGPELPPEMIRYSEEVVELLAEYDKLLQLKYSEKEYQLGDLERVENKLREVLPNPGLIRLYPEGRMDQDE